MHFVGRTLFTFALLGIITASCLNAGGLDLPICDSSYVHIDSLYSSSLLSPLTGSVTSSGDGDWWSGVGVTTGQDTVLTIFPGSIIIDESGTLIDTISTFRIFDYLAIETVRSAILQEYITPGENEIRSLVRVYTPACVERLGSGSATLFIEAPSCEASYREMEFWISNQGSNEVAIVSRGSIVECGTGHESTVQSEEGVSLQ